MKKDEKCWIFFSEQKLKEADSYGSSRTPVLAHSH